MAEQSQIVEESQQQQTQSQPKITWNQLSDDFKKRIKKLNGKKENYAKIPNVIRFTATGAAVGLIFAWWQHKNKLHFTLIGAGLGVVALIVYNQTTKEKDTTKTK